MRIGWIADPETNIVGGAELSSAALQEEAPPDREIVPCPPGRVERADAYVVVNCVRYDSRIVARLAEAPVIKVVSDWWPHGDPQLRAWLLEHSVLVVLRSPLHRQHFPWPIATRIELLPSPIRLASFQSAALPAEVRNGRAIWIGRLTNGFKGEAQAARWAEAQRIHIDFYGGGPEPWTPTESTFVHWHGQAQYKDVPRLLGSYTWFVYLPQLPGSFGRTLVEAWAAGCTIVTNSFPGALWWIEHRPGDLERGAELFWQAVDRALGGGVAAGSGSSAPASD